MSPSLLKILLALLLLGLARPAPAELSIAGVDRNLERNIRAFAALADEPCDAEEWRLRRRFRSLESDVRAALQPFGYYSATITSSLTVDKDCWHVQLDVAPGKPVLLRDIDIDLAGSASTDPAFTRLLPPPGLESGKPLRHANYESFKRSLQVLAGERGYFEAAFTASRLDVWPEDRAADVTLHFASGPRYRIGEIRQQQDFVAPSLVEGFLDLETGDWFDGRELARAYNDLSDSGYFSRIEVLPDVDNATAEAVPVLVALEPAKRIEYTVGVGASTDNGPRFRAGFRNRRINRKGHQLRTDLGISTVLQGLSAEYRKPLADPRAEWMSYTSAVSREDNDTFTDETFRLGLRRSTRVRNDWIRTLALDYSFESYTVGEVSDDSSLLLPSIGYDRKFADKDLYPDRGYRLGVELRGASQSLGSTTSFAQARAWTRWIRATGSDSRILARATAGMTIRPDFAELPPSIRFFAGGDESIRGFGYESLGPEDDEGNVIGGTNLLVASVEYEHRLKGNFFGAVFVDAGNAFDGTDFDAAVGTGLGLKWRSPIGAVRVYLGYPLTGDEQKVRLHIRLGAEL